MTGSHTRRMIAALLAALLLGPLRPEPGRAAEPGSWQSLAVTSFRGDGRLALHVSRDWTAPQPDITRAVITIHGERRDAGHYDDIAARALSRATSVGAPATDRDTLLVTPRFAGDDEADPQILRWDENGWIDGALATLPAALGSFEAMDALIARLSDRTLFPALSTIVLAGHSAGGQFVQRYAVLGHGEARAAQAGITLRYVVANASSYAYFTPDRPVADGGFAPFPVDRCPRVDRWKYGMQALPAYADDARPAELERDYVRRDVTYLLGALDTDPELAALDASCAAEAQGATHFERGHDYFRYLQARHPSDLRQQLHDVPGIGHDATGMLTSDCALAAMFDAPLCGHPAGTIRPAASVAEIHMPATPAPTMPPPGRLQPPRLSVPRTGYRPARSRRSPAWQRGGWEWTGDAYVWIPGRLPTRAARPAPFVPAHWQFDGYGWQWIPAHWL